MFAYHTYPGYGQNLNPETMDYGAYGEESPAKLRELVRDYPGIRQDIEFWDDEFNSIPSWVGSDESVQAKYIPRGMIYNWAQGVRTFVWLLTAGVDGNEYDDFGFIHGLRNLPDDFTPRPVYYALQNTNALFSDTQFDASIRITPKDLPALHDKSQPFLAYGFRSKTGKPIVAYWLAAHSQPGKSLNAVRRLDHRYRWHAESRADRCLDGGGRAGSSGCGPRFSECARTRQRDGHRRQKLFRLARSTRSAEFAGGDYSWRGCASALEDARRRANPRHRRAAQGRHRRLDAHSEASRRHSRIYRQSGTGGRRLLPRTGGEFRRRIGVLERGTRATLTRCFSASPSREW